MARGIKPFANTGEIDLGDQRNHGDGMVDAIRTNDGADCTPAAKSAFEGDVPRLIAARQKLLVSPAQYIHSTDSPSVNCRFLRWFRWRVHGTASVVLGEAGLWNGVDRQDAGPIRFYAGDTIKYCADAISWKPNRLFGSCWFWQQHSGG